MDSFLDRILGICMGIALATLLNGVIDNASEKTGNAYCNSIAKKSEVCRPAGVKKEKPICECSFVRSSWER